MASGNSPGDTSAGDRQDARVASSVRPRPGFPGRMHPVTALAGKESTQCLDAVRSTMARRTPTRRRPAASSTRTRSSRPTTPAPSKVQALKAVDFAVERGEMVAVMGPSGCGKTTLLNCLSGLDNVDSGQIWLEGKDLATMSDRERTDYRARRMGFIFQVYNLLPVLTAVENVELPLLVSGVSPKEARSAVDRGAGAGRAREVGDAPAGRALRRPAPARHDRPLARQQPGHRLGRRADRRARLQDGRRDHGPAHAS